MKCECGTEMKSRKENYRYTESGLDNVILLGVEVRRCRSCGRSEVVLPRLEELHRTIARTVATGSSPLRPQEIRFLRKYLGYSGADFARVIGVSPETLSRWENGKAEPSRMVDLLLRYMALTTLTDGVDHTNGLPAGCSECCGRASEANRPQSLHA